MAKRVLVVDDDPNILRLIEVNLMARGYHADAVGSGEEGLALLKQGEYDCLLLDLMLPGIGGLEVIGRVRERTPMPIVVMSALGDEENKVEALDLGADDYLTKPFGVAELLARVRAAIRRYRCQDDERSEPLAGVYFDPGGGFVRLGEATIKLTPIEYALLRELARKGGNTASHAELLDRVWGRGAGEDHYLHVYVARLRRKLGNLLDIESVPGVGYRLKV